MKQNVIIRPARQQDLIHLLEIENSCFTTDILSRRSFQRFIQPGPHDLLIAEIRQGKTALPVGYVLVLYRTGTSLARLYSLAVTPAYRGFKIAQQLVTAAEQSGRERHCAFMRLEVATNNEAAINLYKKFDYHAIATIEKYYDDGSDALRMEKRIYTGKLKKGMTTSYYQQTTEFTCGPAALMMALKTLDKQYQMTTHEELQIWREATTIYMTSGHGGCSPYGLALSAWQRHAKVDLYINQSGVPFIDSVRDPEKKRVIQHVHEDFVQSIKKTDIRVHVQELSADKLEKLLRSGHAILALISTWRLNRNKAPHWVFVAGADEHFVYINDPDTTDMPWQSETDYILVPISTREFINMASFGQSKLRAILVLEPSKHR